MTRHVRGRHKSDVFCSLFVGESQVLTASADQRTILTDVRTGALVRRVNCDFRIFDAAIAPDGHIAVCGKNVDRVGCVLALPAPSSMVSIIHTGALC